MDTWAWLWIAWFFWSLVPFLVLETYAYRDGVPGNTLSEKVWLVLKAEGPLKKWRRVIRIVFLAAVLFLVWLVVHFATGGWV